MPYKQSSFELIINTGDDDEFRVQGFKRNPLFIFLFYLFGFLTGGILFLFGYWYPVKRFIYTHSSCSLNRATAVLIYQFNVSQVSGGWTFLSGKTSGVYY